MLGWKVGNCDGGVCLRWWLGRCRNALNGLEVLGGSVLDWHILTAHLKASAVGNRVGSGYWWTFSDPDTSKSYVPIADTLGIYTHLPVLL